MISSIDTVCQSELQVTQDMQGDESNFDFSFSNPLVLTETLAVEPADLSDVSEDTVDLFSKWIRTESVKDTFIQQIVSELASSVCTNKSEFHTQNGLLYRRVHPKGSPVSYLQLVVPEVLRKDVLLQFHDSKFACHFGVERTLGLIQKRY